MELSRSLERNCHSRGIEETLRCKNQLSIVQTSDEDCSSTERRSRSISPRYGNLKKLTKTINNELHSSCTQCSNHELISKGRSSKSNKILTNANSKIQCLRESMELRLISGQVNESSADERQATLIQHLHSITNTLDALIHHIQSLQLSYSSCCRLRDLGQQLVLLSPMSINFITTLSADVNSISNQDQCDGDKIVEQLSETLKTCTTNRLTSDDHLRSLINDYRMKRDDFSIATKNFQCLLNNSILNYTQLQKLCRQYESILQDCQHKRHIVNLELPKMIRMRLDALQKGFQLLNQYYSDHEYLKSTGNIFKLIGECLYGDDSSEEEIKQRKTPPKPLDEICQRCKINRVEKI